MVVKGYLSSSLGIVETSLLVVKYTPSEDDKRVAIPLALVTESLSYKFNSFVIVDDLIATGGTANCVYQILSGQNKKVNGLSVVIEIEELNARSKLPFEISSQIMV